MIKNVDLSSEVVLQIRMNDVLKGLKIHGECVKVGVFRHLAFFDIKLSLGTSVSKLETRVREIGLGIHSKTAPIVKVVSDEGIVRIQVAMRKADSVSLEKDILCKKFIYPGEKDMMLPIVLGESSEGENVMVDFATNPHTLICGSTGSGKSVLMHNLVANMVYLNALGARDIELYLVDPKQVEFVAYAAPEFKEYVVDVISDYDSIVDLMERLEIEMESRYALLKEKGYRSLSENPSLMSQIVVVIDEVADIIVNYDKASKRFQRAVASIAQKARAAGIHIIMATQRPSTDVITGTIKANFPARIACKTSSKVDSQVILGAPGAEGLMGRGDAIITGIDSFDMTRFQVAFSEPVATSKFIQKIKNVKASKAKAS